MKHLILSLLLIISVGTIYAQQTQAYYSFSTSSNNATATLTATNSFSLGDQVLTIARHGSVESEQYVLLSLHNNETTSIQVAKEFITEHRGLFIELQNNKQRIIRTNINRRTIVIDPNRIFTTARNNGVRDVNNKIEHIRKNIGDFSQFILNEIPANKVIVAMHNNTDGEYTIRSYQKHPAIKKDAKLLHINPDMDEDDFFLTTDRNIFNKLKEKNVNVVLQSENAYDDGSLSIYCAKNNRPYVNIETQMGHAEEQKKMLAIVAEILK